MTSQDQKQKQPAATTPEEASAELKTQLSNFLGFFSKLSSDITTSSTKLVAAFPEKNPITLIEAKRKKSLQKAPEPKDTTPRKTPTEKQEKLVTPEKPAKTERSQEAPASARTIDDKIEEKPASKPQSKKGDKSQRGPVLKEGTMHIEPPKKEAVKSVPAPSYNSLGDLFGSIGKFFSKTAESIETGTANAYAKVQGGLDLNNKIKNGLRVPDKKAIAAAEAAKALAEEKERIEKAEAAARKSALDSASKKKLEEAKRMKENFEKQLKNLEQEIALLERDDGRGSEDGSSRSRQNLDKKEKKAFRINSQKSGRDSANHNSSQPNLPKPQKKMLVPLEDGKQPAGKTLKPVASQPLYMRMEKEFMQNVVFPELEARKEKLKMKREFYKPMDDREMREHALKYEERRKVFAPSLEKEELKQVPLNFVKSHTYKKILEIDKEEKIKGEQKANEKKLMKDKQVQYAKLVKEMFFPKPDPKDDLISKENLQEIIARSQKAELPMMGSTSASKETNYMSNVTGGARVALRKKKSREDLSHQPIPTQYSPERSYQPYDYLKRKNPRILPPAPKKKPVAQAAEEDGLKENILGDFETNRQVTEGEEVIVKQKKKAEVKKPRMVSMSPVRGERKVSEHLVRPEKALEDDTARKELSEPEAVKKSYPNYLAEIRKKRIEQEKNGGKKYGQWEKILKKKGLSQQEKVNNIMSDINRMEHQAKLKEDKLRQHDLQKEYEPLELEDEVGEMYLESIKAKLAIIKDLS